MQARCCHCKRTDDKMKLLMENADRYAFTGCVIRPKGKVDLASMCCVADALEAAFFGWLRQCTSLLSLACCKIVAAGLALSTVCLELC